MNARLALWLHSGRTWKLHQANRRNGTHMANGWGLWYCFGRLCNTASFRCYSATDLHKSSLRNNRHTLDQNLEEEMPRSLRIMITVTLVIYHYPRDDDLDRVSVQRADKCLQHPQTSPSSSLRLPALHSQLLATAEINQHCSYPNTSYYTCLIRLN